MNAPRPIDVIFNCILCNATLPDVYKDAELDKGFRDANDATHQEPVTRMWLAECTHFFCGRHLEGGGMPARSLQVSLRLTTPGIPFHRSGEIPRAPCPYCVSQKGDNANKILYGIRGYQDKQYDSHIPKNWFDVPPVPLTSEGEGSDAMRAMAIHMRYDQYDLLMRYSFTTYRSFVLVAQVFRVSVRHRMQLRKLRRRQPRSLRNERNRKTKHVTSGSAFRSWKNARRN